MVSVVDKTTYFSLELRHVSCLKEMDAFNCILFCPKSLLACYFLLMLYPLGKMVNKYSQFCCNTVMVFLCNLALQKIA